MNLDAALPLIARYTSQTFWLDLLGRPAAIDRRVEILSALYGTPVPKRLAGINLLRTDLYAAAGIDRNACLAVQADRFAAACKERLANISK